MTMSLSHADTVDSLGRPKPVRDLALQGDKWLCALKKGPANSDPRFGQSQHLLSVHGQALQGLLGKRKTANNPKIHELYNGGGYSEKD